MITTLLENHLGWTHNSEEHRKAFLNVVCAGLLACTNLFFIIYNLTIEHNVSLVAANGVTLLLAVFSQYLLFSHQRLLLSSLLINGIVMALTHFYIVCVGNQEYALVFAMVTPILAIVTLPFRVSLFFISGQFVFFNYWLYSHFDTWQPTSFDIASYANLVAVWFILSTLIFYLERSREKAYRELNQLNKTLEICATVDGLTQVYNRRYTEKLIAQQAKGYCLALIDVDNFKQLNDTYGHLIGDEVLKQIAKVLTEVFPQPNLVGRWGGEEFIVVIPNGMIPSGETLAEHARKQVSETNFKICLPVSISIGLVHNHDDSYDDALRVADHALYRAKAQGKNCVVTSTFASSGVTEVLPPLTQNAH